MDCFIAEFIIGPAEGGTRWLLAMTGRGVSVAEKDLHYYEPASGHGLRHDPFNAIIQKTGEFVWNLATMDLAQQMNLTAAHVAKDVNEFAVAGLTAAPSKRVNVPRVAESPVSFECKVSQIIQLQGADGKTVQA